MTTTATDAKEIRYCRTNHDYDAYLNGQYIGSYANYHAAEAELDSLASEQARQTAWETADNDADAAADRIMCEVPFCGELAVHIPIAPDGTQANVCCDHFLEMKGYSCLCFDDDYAMVERTYACMAETCAQAPRHFLRDAPLCCEHYAEATGFACDCDTGPNAPLLAANPPVSDPDPLTCSGCGARILIADYYAILSSTYRVPACCIDTISKMAQRDLAAMGLDIPADDPTPPPWSCMVCETNAHHIQQCDQIRARLFAPTPIDADALLAEADAVLLSHHMQSFNAAYCLSHGIITPVQLATWGS